MESAHEFPCSTGYFKIEGVLSFTLARETYRDLKQSLNLIAEGGVGSCSR